MEDPQPAKDVRARTLISPFGAKFTHSPSDKLNPPPPASLPRFHLEELLGHKLGNARIHSRRRQRGHVRNSQPLHLSDHQDLCAEMTDFAIDICIDKCCDGRGVITDLPARTVFTSCQPARPFSDRKRLNSLISLFGCVSASTAQCSIDRLTKLDLFL